VLKVSVITPSYNQAAFIRRTIDSVHSQAGPFELEHIVVDGGSDDGTLEILRSCGESVRWLSEPDRGQADAVNKGFALASGDVLCWLNSDDVFEPGALKTVAEVFAAEPETQWLYGKVRIIDAADREIRRAITWYKTRRMRRYSYARLLAENWICQMGVFWRRSAAEEVGPLRVELHYNMDYDYWLRLGARWRGRFVDRYLACFRWQPVGKTPSGFHASAREALEVACRAAGGRYPWSILQHRFNRAKNVTAYAVLEMLGA